jgi:hypothetical protein
LIAFGNKEAASPAHRQGKTLLLVLRIARDIGNVVIRERAGRRGIRLGSTLDKSVDTIRADERKIKQVLLNLLSDDGASEDRSARPDCSARACREQPAGRLKGFGSEVVLRDGMDQLTIEPVEIAEESVAQPQGAPDDRVEHALHICRR